MGDYEGDLVEIDEAWEKAETKDEGTYEEVPLGSYQVEVQSVVEKRTKPPKNHRMLSWRTKVLTGAHKGRLIWKNMVVTKASAWKAKKELALCGFPVQSYSELLSNLDALKGMTLEVKVEQDGEYRNVNILRRIDMVNNFPGGEPAPF